MSFFERKKATLHKRFIDAAAAGDIQRMKSLSALGAEVNGREDGTTPLFRAARAGQEESVRFLLGMGANINDVSSLNSFHGRTALMAAAYEGYGDVVKILLAAGADRSLRDSVNDSAEDDARNRGYDGVAKLIRDFGYVANAEEVMLERRLADRLLQEIFNFRSLERISLVRKDAYSSVEAMTRESFSEIADQTSIRKAFEEYARRGGKIPESAVFPNVLFKSSPPR